VTFFAARQPILDNQRNVIAYELLFRDGIENVFPQVNEETATAKIVEGIQLHIGLDSLAKDKPAFVNFTEESLQKGYPLLLPKDKCVIEILENVPPTRSLLKICQSLKQKGYVIALDDYEHQRAWEHFFPFIDIIKVDYTLSSADQISEVVAIVKRHQNIKLLAEKIETYEEFEHATEMGFDYFQGYFFCKPEMLSRQSLNPSTISLVTLMTEMSEPAPNVKKMTSAIENDVHLSYKLLKFTQSPLFKRKTNIQNIKQAIVSIGLEELRRFISLLFTAQFSESKPAELATLAHNRAHFCEKIYQSVGLGKQHASAFLVGMLSLLDAMLDSALHEVINDLPVSNDIKQALVNKKGPLYLPLQLCELLEKGDWEGVNEVAGKLDLSFQQINDHYRNAIAQTSERMAHI
jgi:EAL and modified HD-GYP domain-containing signal transduction protein